MKKKSSYVIGSGWWCAEKKDDDKRAKFFGSDQIRSKSFHSLWYASICEFTDPVKIIIVDSASPVLPEMDRADSRLEFVRLSLNAGHSTSHVGKYSGWMRAVLLGLEYAMLCDADYYVYVEQDVLLKGKGIVEACIEQMRSPYMFGSGDGTPQLLQQSFFIVRRDGMRRFVDRIHAINESDSEICPEDKFFLASSRMGMIMIVLFCRVRNMEKGDRKTKYLNFLFRLFKGYDDLPFGFGRTRPIDFKSSCLYFQHGSEDEITSYLAEVTAYCGQKK